MSKSSKEPKPYKYPLMVVVWDDAQSDTGWEEPPKTLEPSLATSVGFMIRQTSEHILLCGTFDEENTNNRFQIPKAIIKSMKEIK